MGCPKNEADSGTLVRRLRAQGVTIADDPDDATHIVVNTCGFIQDAKEESIAAILEAVGSYPEQDVLVMGCLVERYRDELAAEIPEVAGWFGVGEVDALVGRVAATATDAEVLAAGGRTQSTSPVSPAIDRHAYAYVKISDGCDHRCTFCAIPAIKGPYQAQSIVRDRGTGAGCAGRRGARVGAGGSGHRHLEPGRAWISPG